MRKGFIPVNKTKNPEPKDKNSINWVIWAAWSDRISFEEIKKTTGKSESEVIKIMRYNLKKSSFLLWRKRVYNQSLKHQKKFKFQRKNLIRNINLKKYLID